MSLTEALSEDLYCILYSGLRLAYIVDNMSGHMYLKGTERIIRSWILSMPFSYLLLPEERVFKKRNTVYVVKYILYTEDTTQARVCCVSIA